MRYNIIQIANLVTLCSQMKEEEQALLHQQEIEIMGKLKEAIKSGRKMERTSQPAIVMENKEPPDIPELKMGEMVDSPFTGEDAIRYLARLSLGARKDEVEGEGEVKGGEEGGIEGEEVKGEEVRSSEEDVSSEVKGEDGVESSMETSGVEVEGEKSEKLTAKAEEKEGTAELNNSDSESISSKAMGKELTKKAKSSKSSSKKKSSAKKGKKSSRKQRRKSGKAEPQPDSDSWEEQRLKLYQEIEKDTREALIVAAEAINRNQTPVVQESKVYSIPGRRGGHKAPPTQKTTPPNAVNKTPPVDMTELDDPVTPTDDISTETTPTDTSTLNEESLPTNTETTPTDSPPETSATDEEASLASNETTPSNDESPPTSNEATPTEQAPPVSTAKPPKHRKTREEIREEEIRKRFPGTRAWPTQEECDEKPLPKTVVFTSTWLSVTAKGVK